MNKFLPRLFVYGAVFTLVACADLPANFLQTQSPTGDKWFNEYVDVDLREVPLGDLPKRGPFREMKLVLTGVDGNSLITLQVEHVRRRQALWMLADRYGLAMTAAQSGDQPPTVTIMNRVLRPEIRPLP